MRDFSRVPWPKGLREDEAALFVGVSVVGIGFASPKPTHFLCCEHDLKRP